MNKIARFNKNFEPAIQLEDGFRNALNEDFEAFGIEDYLFIKGFVTDRLSSTILNESDHPILKSENIHHEISQLIERNPDFVTSKIRRWALTLIKSASDQFVNERKAEKELDNRLLLLFRNNSSKLHKIITWIIKVLEEDDIEITDQHIGTCMQQFGLHLKKYKGYFHAENDAKDFIKKISELIQNKEVQFNAWSLGATMQGLVDLEDVKEVRNLIGIIGETIEKHPPILNSKTIGASLYSLQNHHDSKEIIQFIKSLTEIAINNKIPLNARSVSSVIFGLQNFIHLPKLSKTHNYVIHQLNKLKSNEIGEITLVSLIQGLKMSKIDIPEEIMYMYEDYLEKNSNKRFKSNPEQTSFGIIKKMFPNQPVIHNHLIDGFELDIYLPNVKLNIEIDGSQHKNNSSREDKRDEHLILEHGITILRIPVYIVRDDPEFTDRIINTYNLI